MIQRIAGLGDGSLAGKFRHKAGIRSGIIHKLNDIVGQDMLQKKVEGMAMVLMREMAEFVEKDIILKGRWEADDLQIQIYISLGRTATPIGGIMLYRDLVVCESIPRSKFFQPWRELLLGLTAHLLDFRDRWRLNVTKFFLLPCHRLKYPTATRLEEYPCRSIGYYIGHRYAYTLDRVHTYADVPSPYAFTEHHRAYLRILIYLSMF